MSNFTRHSSSKGCTIMTQLKAKFKGLWPGLSSVDIKPTPFSSCLLLSAVALTVYPSIHPSIHPSYCLNIKNSFRRGDETTALAAIDFWPTLKQLAHSSIYYIRLKRKCLSRRGIQKVLTLHKTAVLLLFLWFFLSAQHGPLPSAEDPDCGYLLWTWDQYLKVGRRIDHLLVERPSWK